MEDRERFYSVCENSEDVSMLDADVLDAIADAEAQRYQDEGEMLSGAANGGRYF